MAASSTSAFDEAYARLNDPQRQAVDTIEGPVMVIAGPGTGKTQILALRIANILRQTDADPSSILALTFTESGVASMRTRLVSLMGDEGYRVRVHTFHGFCNEVIRRYPDRFPQIIGREPLAELDAVAIIRELLEVGRPQLLRPHGDPDYYVRDILGRISEAKREHIGPEALAERITTARADIEGAEDFMHARGPHAGKVKGKYADALRSLARAEEFVHIYVGYEAALAERRRYDFEDTILAVIEGLARDDELKRILQEEHQYLLADEHQDANGGQDELLTLLADFHDTPNLFVVGDEKQAIYRFQGASLENFLSFTRRYPNAVVIPLTDNYRSTQAILDAAHQLIAPAAGHEAIARPRLSAAAERTECPLAVIEARDEEVERAEVARRVRACVTADTPPGTIALLARRNADVALFSAALSRVGVPHVAHGQDSALAHPAVVEFLTLLRAVAVPGDDAALYPALLLPYAGVTPADSYRLSRPPEGTALIEFLTDRAQLARAGIHDVDACVAFGSMVVDARRDSVPLLVHIERLLTRSGALAHLLAQPDALAHLGAVRAFFQYLSDTLDAHPEYTLSDLLIAVDAARTYGLSVTTSSGTQAPVAVMTVHRAKGMEFDHVYIPQVYDRLWGEGRRRERLPLPLYAQSTEGAAAVDDERRLFYVAMTRARKTLTLSYACAATDGAPRVPSRYLAELAEYCREESAEVAAPTFLAPVPTEVPRQLSEAERTQLRTRLSEQGLSVTALNNYLESPWKYFFLNLLRIPTARPPHLLYGTAVDRALKWYADERAAGRAPAADELVGAFSSELARMPLSARDRTSYRTRGETALLGYHAMYAAAWVAHAESDVRIAVPFATDVPELPVVTLRGELDRVEYIEGTWVRIVDYKTGKPKTRGEITGTTKSSHGGLKRQLDFYRLLVTLDEGRDWRVDEGVLDFVEPDVRGKYRREVFPVTQEDTDALSELIRTSIREIATFAFWERPCDPAAWSAEGCALVDALRRNG